MASYRIGAPRTVRPTSSGIGRSRQGHGGGQRVAHPDYPCHAIDQDGDALCGFTGTFTTLDEPSWDDAVMISRCADCENGVDAAR